MSGKLDGIFIPAVTPFYRDGAVDFESMKHNYEKWNESDVAGYMCLGSNGEFRSLSDDESLEIVRAASVYCSRKKTLIAGVGRESLHETLSFIERLRNHEIMPDYVSVITPGYFAGLMSDKALVEYYEAVADFSPYPVLLYCAPKFVNSVCISAEAVRQLSKHPNIYGIKDTSENMMGSYMEMSGHRDDFMILSGSLGNLQMCVELGGKGSVVSAANFLPDECAHVMSLYCVGQTREAKDYLDALKKIVSETVGSAGVAGLKYMMNLTGYKGGYPRLPVPALDWEKKEKMKCAFERMRSSVLFRRQKYGGD